MSTFKMAQAKMISRVIVAINSVFAGARREIKKKDIERIKEMKERAEQLKKQTQEEEEIKSQGERDMLQQVYLVSLEEEVEKMKKTNKRLREYDWKEELEMIHSLLHTRFSLLLTNTGN